jgi:hypothetical protein
VLYKLLGFSKFTEEMEKSTNVKKEELARRSFINLVFSWSLGDVLNKDLYKNQVGVFFFLSN